MDYLVLNTDNVSVQTTCFVNLPSQCPVLECGVQCPEAACGFRVNQ